MSRTFVFNREAFGKMLAAQKKLAETLRRIDAEGDTEAFLAALACMRLAKNLLDFYPEAGRARLAKLAEDLMNYTGEEPEAQLKRIVTLH